MSSSVSIELLPALSLSLARARANFKAATALSWPPNGLANKWLSLFHFLIILLLSRWSVCLKTIEVKRMYTQMECIVSTVGRGKI